jgi:hypothetical protein
VLGSHLGAGETVLNREYYCGFSGFGWPNVALQSTFSFSGGGSRCGLVRRSVRRTCSGAKLNATELRALGPLGTQSPTLRLARTPT